MQKEERKRREASYNSKHMRDEQMQQLQVKPNEIQNYTKRTVSNPKEKRLAENNNRVNKAVLFSSPLFIQSISMQSKTEILQWMPNQFFIQ